MSKQRLTSTESYRHADEAVLRPEIGTQPQFRSTRVPRTYRYDSSLSPALEWDSLNAAREIGEWLIAQIEDAVRLEPPFVFPASRRIGDLEVSGLADAVAHLKALSGPFLNWSGKAERLSFDVPTLPLFLHERHSTKAILATLKGHERDRQIELDLFGDPNLPLHQQLEAYEHRGGWVNRLILGDSLVVMNSLLEYEGLAGDVQMIYVDPPYGVKFGSNFQPFVRKREVQHGPDENLTREPEMVQAYRDTWELGLHSYLTDLRDRVLLARELLATTGSIFVQISDENVHYVRTILDEIFGSENFVTEIIVQKTGGLTQAFLPRTFDILLWYAKDRERAKYRQLFLPRSADPKDYQYVEEADGSRRALTAEERSGVRGLPIGSRLFSTTSLESANPRFEFTYRNKTYSQRWKTNLAGLERLANKLRLSDEGKTLRYIRFMEDFPVRELQNVWDDTMGERDMLYVVQTNTRIVERCILMTTDPGDLILDPTCGSGTSAYVAEQWGRRWITIDTSRVPLALTRQRLLTASYPFYALQDPNRGPAGGFVYKRKQNKRGEEVGGIVPHVTLKSIANDEPPAEEVLVDRPEVDSKITRVTGPFAVEATIPTPVDLDGDGEDESGVVEDGSFTARLLEALRRNPILQLGGNKTIELRNVRPPGKTLTLSAEAALEPDDAPVAIVFGPENGAVSEKLVYEAAREAHMRSYEQLIVIGFAIEANARALVDKIEHQIGIPATYVQATPDLLMGDLLKTMRSSQLFSVAGLPDVVLRKVDPEEPGGPQRYEVELRGLDTFDPTTMGAEHRSGDDVPAWFLDTDWNDLSFHVSQAFFPRTSAWDNLKKALKTEFDDAVWEHLSGTRSAPFLAGESDEIAVKVIDDRGNELLVVKRVAEAE